MTILLAIAAVVVLALTADAIRTAIRACLNRVEARECARAEARHRAAGPPTDRELDRLGDEFAHDELPMPEFEQAVGRLLAGQYGDAPSGHEDSDALQDAPEWIQDSSDPLIRELRGEKAIQIGDPVLLWAKNADHPDRGDHWMRGMCAASPAVIDPETGEPTIWVARHAEYAAACDARRPPQAEAWPARLVVLDPNPSAASIRARRGRGGA